MSRLTGSHQNKTRRTRSRATDFPRLWNRGQNHGIKTSEMESLFCQNYCNLCFLNRKLHVNKLNSTQWIVTVILTMLVYM